MLIAQLSDLHICRTGEAVFGGRDSAASLERCIDAVNALQPSPDFAVLSGDLVNMGHFDEYMRLKSILERLTARYYLMPGNHDERSTLRRAFPEHRYLGESGPIQYVLDHAGWRVIALDTVVPECEHGELDAARLAWLARTLAEQPQRPSVVFMHHPAFATGIVEMDSGRVRAPGFWNLLARHAQVKRVSCGHVHRALFTLHEGVPVCIAPSTAATLSLQLDAQRALAVTSEPVGFLLHQAHADELRTHCVSVP
jgi:3',5'-cyclic AMP phosphodiesterase CpdA